MKKLLLLSLLCASSFAAQLGVQFNSTNGNLVSPATLSLSNLVLTNVIASRALVVDSNKVITNSPVTSTELGYLSGVTSSVQDQINNIDGGGGGGSANTIIGPGASNRFNPVKIIFDTDPGCDCDDMSDIGIALQLHTQGELEILAMTSPIQQNWNVPNIEAMTRYYGYPMIPLGTATNSPINLVGTNVSVACDSYGTYVMTNYYNSVTNAAYAQDAKQLWRRVLAAQTQPNSVTIVTVGNLRNLYNLWNSAADTNSVLDGPALVASKVKEIVVVAGIFPTGNEYNIYSDPTAYGVLSLITNVPVVYAGIELAGIPPAEKVVVGGDSQDLPSTNPAREAYRIFTGGGPRQAWGGLGLLYAARSNSFRGTTLFTKTVGQITFPPGANGWTNTPAFQAYLSLAQSTNYFSDLLNSLFMLYPNIREPSTSSGFGRFTTGPTFTSISGSADISSGFGFGNDFGDTRVFSSGTRIYSFWQQGGIFDATHGQQFVDVFGGPIEMTLQRESGTNLIIRPGDVNTGGTASLRVNAILASHVVGTDGTTNAPAYIIAGDENTGFNHGAFSGEWKWIGDATNHMTFFSGSGGGIAFDNNAGIYWSTNRLGEALRGGIRPENAVNGVRTVLDFGGVLAPHRMDSIYLGESGLGIFYGSGSPEGVLAKPVGSLYLRSNGATDTTVYRKETGAATSAGWVASSAAVGGNWIASGTTNSLLAGNAFVNGILATNSLTVPNSAAPTTTAFGQIAGDSDAWAASHGALQVFDGTANTFLLGTLASDIPSNGQVPTWNTGGNITWETPSGGGGGGGGGTTNELWYDITQYGGSTANADNTAALRATINAAFGGTKTNIPVNAVVYIPEGVWNFTSNPQNWGNSENCVIPIPVKTSQTLSGGPPLASYFKIRGKSAPSFWAGSTGNGAQATNGTVINITSTNSGSFIASIGFSETWANDLLFNFTTIEFENLNFISPTNTAMATLNLERFPNANVHDTFFLKPVLSSSTSPQPTVGGWAIKMPRINCGPGVLLDRITVDGYDVGISISEHTVGGMVNLASCNIGLLLQQGTLPNYFVSVLTTGCASNIYGLAANNLTIADWQIERVTGTTWRTSTVDFTDSNATTGTLNWKRLDNNNTANNNKPVFASTAPNLIFRQLDIPLTTLYQGSANYGFRGSRVERFSADGISPSIGLYKGRGTKASPAVPNSGDGIGQYIFGVYDGHAGDEGLLPTASVFAETTGTTTSGSGPTGVGIATGSSGSSTRAVFWSDTKVMTYFGSEQHSMAVGSAFTLTDTNNFYLLNVDAQTATLPTAVGKRGRTYGVKVIAPATIGTVATTSSQLIDGALTSPLTASNSFVRVVSDGTNWWTFGKTVGGPTTKITAYSVTALDTGIAFNINGATAKVVFTLPAAITGLRYTFNVTDADGIDITSVGDDVIQYGASVTAAAATITSIVKGSSITLESTDGATWFATALVGTFIP